MMRLRVTSAVSEGWGGWEGSQGSGWGEQHAEKPPELRETAAHYVYNTNP